MARDGVANIVGELQGRGFDPRRIGPDSWESHCPVHGGNEHSLAITRNEFNHVVLECRSPQNCPQARIIGSLGLSNDRVYAETPDWLAGRLSRVESGRRPSRSPRLGRLARPAPRGRSRPCFDRHFVVR